MFAHVNIVRPCSLEHPPDVGRWYAISGGVGLQLTTAFAHYLQALSPIPKKAHFILGQL